MTKSDIADIIRDKTGLQKKDILNVIDNFLKIVSETVEKGERVELRRFGTFSKSELKSRKIYSPILKKKIDAPSRTRIIFKSSRETDSINETKGD